MIRLFVALTPPASVRDLLLDLQDGVADARWQDEEQLHLTLRFVGEVEPRCAEDLAHALAGLRAPAPTLTIAGVGAFGGHGRSGSLWAGVTPREPLLALHRKVDQICVTVGLAPERRAFLPHITVARLPRRVDVNGPEAARWIAGHAFLRSGPFTATRVTLFQSRLGRDGASYEPVLDVRLTAPAEQSG